MSLFSLVGLGDRGHCGGYQRSAVRRSDRVAGDAQSCRAPGRQRQPRPARRRATVRAGSVRCRSSSRASSGPRGRPGVGNRYVALHRGDHREDQARFGRPAPVHGGLGHADRLQYPAAAGIPGSWQRTFGQFMIAVSEAITVLGAARSSEMAIMNCPAHRQLPLQDQCCRRDTPRYRLIRSPRRINSQGDDNT